MYFNLSTAQINELAVPGVTDACGAGLGLYNIIRYTLVLVLKKSEIMDPTSHQAMLDDPTSSQGQILYMH